MPTLLILDTFNFLHRAYHALPPSFRDINGEPVNAVYGVTSMVINVLDHLKPDYCIAALDSEKPTFRVEEYTGYKAHRKPMEEDLSSQIPKVFEMLDAFGISQITVNGYEADDIIGTLTKKFYDQTNIVIVSNDRDLWQLINGRVQIMVPGQKGNVEWFNKEDAVAKLGFEPNQVADFKGLRGDPSDNIPGVYGIGEVTAKKLIKQFGSIENLYININQVENNTLKEKLLNNYEQALISKKLAQIILDVPFEFDLNDARFELRDSVKVENILKKYNFKSLLRRMGYEKEDGEKDKSPKVSDNQLGLF